MQIAIIDTSINRVVNLGTDMSQVPNGMLGIASDTANIGDIWDGTSITPAPAYVAPPLPPPPPPPPAAPITVQMWQAKAVLKATPFTPTPVQLTAMPMLAGVTNLLDATTALITASGNGALEAYWTFAPTIVSGDANLTALATQLGLTSAQITALFSAAQSITV